VLQINHTTFRILESEFVIRQIETLAMANVLLK